MWELMKEIIEKKEVRSEKKMFKEILMEIEGRKEKVGKKEENVERKVGIMVRIIEGNGDREVIKGEGKEIIRVIEGLIRMFWEIKRV